MKRNKHLIALLWALAIMAMAFILILDKKSSAVELPTGAFIIGTDTVQIKDGIILK